MSKGLFDDIHHIALVVYDANKTASYLEKIGLGPWQDYPPMTQYKNVTGINVDDFINIKFKVLDLGKIHIQLCQPGIGDSPQKRFLESKGEGVFHISFSVSDIDVANCQAHDLGLQLLMSGRRDDGNGFSFFDTQENCAGITLAIRGT